MSAAQHLASITAVIPAVIPDDIGAFTSYLL
jgi:hypothetical protein